MVKFIELQGLFNNDDIDYEMLGISSKNALENAQAMPVIINTETITCMNASDAGGTSIEFVNGERWAFADKYDEVKLKLMEK